MKRIFSLVISVFIFLSCNEELSNQDKSIFFEIITIKDNYIYLENSFTNTIDSINNIDSLQMKLEVSKESYYNLKPQIPFSILINYDQSIDSVYLKKQENYL